MTTEIRARQVAHLARLQDRVEHLRREIRHVEPDGPGPRTLELQALEWALDEIAALDRLRKRGLY